MDEFTNDPDAYGQTPRTSQRDIVPKNVTGRLIADGTIAAGNIATATATNLNTPSTLVKRDASGNFVAGTITANLIGAVTGTATGNATSGRLINTTSPLTGGGDLTSDRTIAINAASANTASYVVQRDGSGNFTAGTVTVGALTIGEAGNIVLGTTTGTQIGTATTQKLSFHASTPVVQRAGAAQAAVATTGSTQTTPYGYTTAAQADAIVTLVNEIRAALVEKGIIKGSA